MVQKEFQQVGGSGEPAQGEGAELVTVVVVAHRRGKDVGDPVDHGVEPGGVTRGDTGDEVTVAELVGARERHVALVARALALGAVGLGIGLDHLRASDLEDRGGCVPGDGLADRPVDPLDLIGEQ
ncbi:hypothetical protein Q9S36_40070 [Microbacterium sp. ARD31]|uniref:hypothetical protein n=1 Tax=Microbacterium sp. ARD31 TaxID=2962576 RepID=UPI00288146BB|nr:hypothetical protein [Microbacterium sp. ARD31]MDT0186401.1 hypothetical protein [Microbacterium sp. ARD31]